VRTTGFYERMAAQYDHNFMSQRKVYGWMEGFKGGRSNVDDVHSGRSSTVTSIDIKEQIP
jgi:hypothetical protein